MIADGVGNTFQIGKFTVRIGLRPDNPAFAKYIVFRGERLIGTQFSRPSESDCKWLERNKAFATNSICLEKALLTGVRGLAALAEQRARGGAMTRRRGRPRKADAERELQEALAS